MPLSEGFFSVLALRSLTTVSLTSNIAWIAVSKDQNPGFTSFQFELKNLKFNQFGRCKE